MWIFWCWCLVCYLVWLFIMLRQVCFTLSLYRGFCVFVCVLVVWFDFKIMNGSKFYGIIFLYFTEIITHFPALICFCGEFTLMYFLMFNKSWVWEWIQLSHDCVCVFNSLLVLSASTHLGFFLLWSWDCLVLFFPSSALG